MSRSPFWQWRHARPFWGGLFVFLGGTEIFLTVKAPLPVVVHVGMQGFIGYLLPILLALLGLLIIFSPAQRLFYSIVAAVLALASWLTSNLGGFIIGLLMALVGAALTFAWSPTKYELPPPPPPLPPVDPSVVPYQDLFEEPHREDLGETPQPQREDLGEAPQTQPQPQRDDPGEAPLRQEDEAPGVQPETSQSLPRHRRPEPGLLSGE